MGSVCNLDASRNNSVMFTKLLLSHQKTIFALILILCINGIYAYFAIPSQENPTVLVREAIITTHANDMSALRVENFITRQLENELQSIDEIKLMRSTSSNGLSVIHVELYDKYFELDVIWQRIRNKIKQAHTLLPEGIEPSIVNDEFGDVSVMNIAITTEGIKAVDLNQTVKDIRAYLYAIDGVSKISIVGQQQEKIYLRIKHDVLAQYSLNRRLVMEQLQERNIVFGGGRLDSGERSYILEPSGNIDQLTQLESVLISLPNSNITIPLGILANITREIQTPKTLAAYFNGEPATMMSIFMEEGSNIRDFSPKLRQAVEVIAEKLPVGFTLHFASEQLTQVNTIIDNVSINILQSLAIVLVVAMLFLGFRTGLIVGISVPCVMLITFAVMLKFNVVMERLSLATLVISLGLLVDNAIVIAEDFKQKLGQNFSRKTAMSCCIKELSWPLLSSTMTTVLFFMPLILADHVASEFTRSISLVVSIALISSWLLAVTFVPLLCYYFIAPPSQLKGNNSDNNRLAKADGVFIFINNAYQNILIRIMHHRWKFVIFTVLMILGSISLKGGITKQFFPESDRPQLLLYMDLPNGSSIRQTDKQLNRMFTFLKDKNAFPNIVNFSGYAGHNGTRFVTTLNPEDPKENKALIVIDLDEMSAMDAMIKQLYRLSHEEFPLITPRIKRMFIGTSDSNVLRVQLKGNDKEFIYQTAQTFLNKMHNLPGMLDVSMDWGNRVQKISLIVDQYYAKKLGISNTDIAHSLSTHFEGEKISVFREHDELLPIVLIGEDEQRFDLTLLNSIRIYSSDKSRSVILSEVAELSFVDQFSVIEREDMFPTVSIDMRHVSLTAQELKDIIDEDVQLLSKSMPLNHWLEYDAVVEDTKSARKALSANVPLVLVIVILILICQCRSYRKALLILLSIPLMCIGAISGLYIMGGKFGFMVTLGFYSLAGIIINNAIVLVDKIDRERKESSRNELQNIVSACKSRVKPIMMTSLTTSLGLLPLIIYNDPMFFGMSVLLSFGLMIGTLFTLVFVPVLYSLLMRIDVK